MVGLKSFKKTSSLKNIRSLTMPQSFTESQIAQVCELIEKWPYKKLTWKQVCESSKDFLGFVPTRQGLYNYLAVYEAYETKKKRLKAEVKRIPSQTKMLKANAKLQKEIEFLEEQKKSIAEAIRTVEFKAKEVLKISDRLLYAPMMKVDRSVLSNRRQSYKRR